MLTPLCKYKPCRIRHSNPVIVAGTRYPLDSILPCIAPEDLTLTRRAAGVNYFVGSTKKDTIDKFEHALLSINLNRICQFKNSATALLLKQPRARHNPEGRILFDMF